MEYSISTAAYDGHSYDVAFASIKKTGCKHVEIALIEGYVADFTEEDFNKKFASKLCDSMAKHGLKCTSLACHANLNRADAAELLLRRIQFASYLDAPRIILNAVPREQMPIFCTQLEQVVDLAVKRNVQILFENPGDQQENIFNAATDAENLLKPLDANVFGINYDPGNFISHRPGDDVLKDSLLALKYCTHLHIKDVQFTDGRYTFCPIGMGLGAYNSLFHHIKQMSKSPFFSLELPFRLSRNAKGQPTRSPDNLKVQVIEEMVQQSVDFCNSLPNEN